MVHYTLRIITPFHAGELRADHESNAVHVDLRPLTHQQAGGSRLADNFCALRLLKKVAQDVGHHFVHRRGHLVPRGLLPDRDLGLPDGDLDLVLKGLDPLAQDVEAKRDRIQVGPSAHTSDVVHDVREGPNEEVGAHARVRCLAREGSRDGLVPLGREPVLLPQARASVAGLRIVVVRGQVKIRELVGEHAQLEDLRDRVVSGDHVLVQRNLRLRGVVVHAMHHLPDRVRQKRRRERVLPGARQHRGRLPQSVAQGALLAHILLEGAVDRLPKLGVSLELLHRCPLVLLRASARHDRLKQVLRPGTARRFVPVCHAQDSQNTGHLKLQTTARSARLDRLV
mmetsp:Transcript_10083/g.35802  ORF Transcript_10083/g.35802 Transcript_10083/m.35802 type:complete len:340 (+) Transcript_10083:1496-2515(+)